jgi:7-cyano-7-deazaguanine synthase
MKNGEVKKATEVTISYFIIDKGKSHPDLFKIFGNFRFPSPLLELTKFEVLEEYKKLGYSETINKTWFCHTPVKDKTCGVCNPCKAVIEEGLAFRLSTSALTRYKTEMKYGDRKWYIKIKNIRLKIAGY